MTDEEEQAYNTGHRMATRAILQYCLRELGPGVEEDPLRELACVRIELEATRVALRRVCTDHGDNDWPDTLYLADVVDKHLAPWLENLR